MRIAAPSMATTPVSKGQRLGRLEVRQGDAVLARSALVATAPVGTPGFGDSISTALAGIGSVFS